MLTNSNEIPNAPNLQPNQEYYYATNVANARTFGIEFLIANYLVLSRQQVLRTELNYTYLHTSNNEGPLSKYIANHPNHDVGIILAYQTHFFRLSSTSHVIARNAESLAAINGNINSNYFVSHLKLELTPFANNLGLYLNIHNLFDARYQEILGAPMPGRWMMAGITWNMDMERQ